jgi:hypothetical protein
VATKTPGASGYGGAIFNFGGVVSLVGKTLIYNNIASTNGNGYGGAIVADGGGEVKLYNDVEIHHNKASTASSANEALGGAFYLGGSQPTVGTLHLYRANIHHNYALDKPGSTVGTIQAGAIYGAGSSHIEFHYGSDSIFICNNEAASQVTGPITTGEQAIYPDLTKTVYLPQQFRVPVKGSDSATVNLDLGDHEYGYYEVQNGRILSVDLSMAKPFDYIFPYIPRTQYNNTQDEHYASTKDISSAPDRKKFRLDITAENDIHLDKELKFRYCVLNLPPVIQGNGLWLHKGVAYAPLSNFLASPGKNFRDPWTVKKDTIRLVSYSPIHPSITPAMEYNRGSNSWNKLLFVKKDSVRDSTIWHIPLAEFDDRPALLNSEVSFRSFQYDALQTAVITFESIRIQGLFYASDFETGKSQEKDTIFTGIEKKISFVVKSDYEFKSPFIVKRIKDKDTIPLYPKESTGKTFTYDFQLGDTGVYRVVPNVQDNVTTVNLSAFAPSLPGSTVADYYGITETLIKRNYEGYYLGQDKSEAYYDMTDGVLGKCSPSSSGSITLSYLPNMALDAFFEDFYILVDEPAAHIPLEYSTGNFDCVDVKDVFDVDGRRSAVRYHFRFQPASLISNSSNNYQFTPKFTYDLVFLSELADGWVYANDLISGGVHRFPIKKQGDDTIRIYPVGNYNTSVPPLQTFPIPTSLALKYCTQNGNTSANTNLPLNYKKEKNVYELCLPAGSAPGSSNPALSESPKILGDLQTGSNTSLHYLYIGQMPDDFEFRTPGLNANASYSFQGLLGQPFILRSNNATRIPIAIQDSMRAIPVAKKAGTDYYFSSIIAVGHDAYLSIIALDFSEIINKYDREYTFLPSSFSFDAQLESHYITAVPKDGYKYMAPKEVDTDYYSTRVVRRNGTDIIYDIHFFFKPFTGNIPLVITPDFPLFCHTINLGIDPRYSNAEGFSFLSGPDFINDTLFVSPEAYTRRFAIVAQGENRFLTPIVKCSEKKNVQLKCDSVSTREPVPGTVTDLKKVYYYTLIADTDVDITVTASPCTYVNLSTLDRGLQYILPSKQGKGFYIDSIALKTRDLVNIYVRSDFRIEPKVVLFTISGRNIPLDNPTGSKYTDWRVNFYIDKDKEIPSFPSTTHPIFSSGGNSCLIYPHLPPEIVYSKVSDGTLVVDYDKPAPVFLTETDLLSKDTFSIFLGKPYDKLSPKVSLASISDNVLDDQVRGIDTTRQSIKLNGGNNWREGVEYRYEVTINESAILRISLPQYHTVTLPGVGELPKGLEYGSSEDISESSLCDVGRIVSFSLSIQKQYAVCDPVVKCDDGTTTPTISKLRIEDNGNHVYQVSFTMPDHDVALSFATAYHSLTFPSSLPPSLEYVEGYIGEASKTYYYPPNVSALDTITLLVKGNESPPSVSLPDNLYPNFTAFYPEQSLTTYPKDGETIYRYPIRFSGRQILCIFSGSALHQDTIILPPLPEERLEYINGVAGQKVAKPGDLVSFSLRTKGLYVRACPSVSLNGRTLVPVASNGNTYTFSFLVPPIPSGGRSPLRLQPEINLDYFTVEFDAPLPTGVSFHKSSNLRGLKSYLYRAFGHDSRDTLVLSIERFYAAASPEISISFNDNTSPLYPDNVSTDPETSSRLYRYIVSLPYNDPHAIIRVSFAPLTHVWPPLPTGIVYETLPDGLTSQAVSQGAVYCYSKGQKVSFTLRTLNPYINVAPIVHRNGFFVERSSLGAGKYSYSFTAEDNANISFYLPYRIITLPSLNTIEGLHYVGLPDDDDPHYVSPNSDIPFRFTLAVDESKTGAFIPRVLIDGVDLEPESVNGTDFNYSLKTPIDIQPFISLVSRTFTLSLPPLPEGLAYVGDDIPGESQHAGAINKTFTLHVDPDYRAVKPLVTANGTTLVPLSAPDGSSHTYTINTGVNTVVSVAFDYFAVTLPPNLPTGVSYVSGSLGAGTYFRTPGDIFTFSLFTPDANDEAPAVYCNGAFVPAERRDFGLFEYSFTVIGNTTALIAFNNLVLFISIEAPELSVVSEKGQGVHYYLLTGIHEIFVLELDPEYVGLTPILTVNGIQQAAAYVQGNRFTYNLNSGGNLEVHASLHYNTFTLEQVPPPYLFLLPAAGTYYRDAGVPFQFRVQDYLNLGDPSVTYVDGQSLAPVSHEENEYSYVLNPEGETNLYLIRVASRLSNPLRPPLQADEPSVAYHSDALHLSHLTGRPLLLVNAAGRLSFRILPTSDTYVYPVSLPSGIYFLVSPAYQGTQPIALKFIVR